MTDGRLSGWRVEHDTGSASTLLDPWPLDPTGSDPIVRAARVTGRRALILGSTQDRATIDGARAAAAGVDVLRRTTGGGAVLVLPDAQVWLDVWVPRSHRLWDDDVVRAAAWLGRAWMQALKLLGAAGLRLHDGPSTRSRWSDVICFAGLGPGEIHVGGSKVMGLAQRRTRAGARFHTTAPLQWDAGVIGDLLTMADSEAPAGSNPGDGAPLDDVALGLRRILTTVSPATPDVDVIGAVEQSVIAALP